MMLRRVAAAFLATAGNFRCILGYRNLWMVKARLGIEIALDLRQAVA